MTHIPPLTREARDWLLEQCGADWAFRTALARMPLAPTDPLDAVRARFQPKTRGGHEYEIFAERDGCLWGRYLSSGNGWTSTGWSSIDGKYLHDFESLKDLLPVSPHAALIAELRNVSGVYSSITADLLKRAADALEKQL